MPNITILVIWSHRMDKGDRVDYIATIEVEGKLPDGDTYPIHVGFDPSLDAIEFWKFLAEQHGWPIENDYRGKRRKSGS